MRKLDEAWEYGDKGTKSSIKRGMKVKLLFNTISEGVEVLSGQFGVVQNARVPKVSRKEKTSYYFSTVVMDNGIIIRVPHAALEVIK